MKINIPCNDYLIIFLLGTYLAVEYILNISRDERYSDDGEKVSKMNGIGNTAIRREGIMYFCHTRFGARIL